MWRKLIDDEFTLTKRHLGVLLVLAGIAALVMVFGVEIVRSGPSRFGTLQKIGVLLSAASVVVGLTLWPLGDRPA
jgi:hypothetical protein